MSAVIVVGLIEASGDAGTVAVEPEAYLKGSAERQAFTLHPPEPSVVAPNQASSDECPLATLAPGSRVLLALGGGQDGLAWPTVWQVFVLRDGQAANQAEPPLILSEDELIDQIRSITGRYVVPAEDEGAFSIQGSNIAILVVSLLVVFGIGLALMRVWHRIDPT